MSRAPAPRPLAGSARLDHSQRARDRTSGIRDRAPGAGGAVVDGQHSHLAAPSAALDRLAAPPAAPAPGRPSRPCRRPAPRRRGRRPRRPPPRPPRGPPRPPRARAPPRPAVKLATTATRPSSTPPITTAASPKPRLEAVGQVEQAALVGALARWLTTTFTPSTSSPWSPSSLSASPRPAAHRRSALSCSQLRQPLGGAPRAAQADRGASRAAPRPRRAPRFARGTSRSRRPGQRLDPAHVGRARALGDDREDPQLGRVRHVGPSAELARDVVHLDHPHPLAVLLAEQRHRAERLGLGAAPSASRAPARLALIQSLTRSSISRISSRGQRRAVREVEAELVRAHRRARLADVGPQPLAKRRVQQVGGGVVSHRRVAGRVLHLGLHPRARLRRRRRPGGSPGRRRPDRRRRPAPRRRPSGSGPSPTPGRRPRDRRGSPRASPGPRASRSRPAPAAAITAVSA